MTGVQTCALPISVRQVHYGINDIAYEVDLREPRLMIENEVHFPGWTAQVANRADRIAAVEVNGVFRGWVLPAGHYTLVTSFALPQLWLLRAVSALSGLAWLAALAARRRISFVVLTARTAEA